MSTIFKKPTLKSFKSATELFGRHRERAGTAPAAKKESRQSAPLQDDDPPILSDVPSAGSASRFRSLFSRSRGYGTGRGSGSRGNRSCTSVQSGASSEQAHHGSSASPPQSRNGPGSYTSTSPTLVNSSSSGFGSFHGAGGRWCSHE